MRSCTIPRPSDLPKYRTVLLGVVLGVLVSLFSVGAGALGTVALLFLFPRMPTVRIGTNIALVGVGARLVLQGAVMNYADDPAFVQRAADAATMLQRIARRHAPAAFACSFGAEDMVLLDLIADHAPSIEVFTLDTGRLPRETYELLDTARSRYAMDIRVVRPDAGAVERYVARHGLDGFYEGVPQRRACCDVRKVQPLRRALEGRHAWITGLRREQSEGRTQVAVEDYDFTHGLLKFNPLADWTTVDVWTYLRANHVPYNALHDRGYPSIGCEPCTRSIRPGEPLRAGRWWWEGQGTHKECGLHVMPIRVVSAPATQGTTQGLSERP